MKIVLKLFIVLVILAVLCVAGYYYFFIRQEIQPENVIIVSGNIEATEVRLSFRASGKIQKLYVDEGYLVKKGDIVARLDTDELEKAKNEAQAKVRQAQAQLQKTEKDFQRIKELFDSNVTSQEKLDTAEAELQVACSNVDALEATLALAETRLGFAELKSPLDSFIIVKSAEEGEVVQEGSPVFTIIDLKNVWLTAYINETNLGKVTINQPAYVTIDTFPGEKFKGRVSFISQKAEFTPKQIQTQEERVKLVYRIKIDLENSDLKLKPGMPADGYIRYNNEHNTDRKPD